MCPPGLACIDSQILQKCSSLPSSAVSLQAGDTASCFLLHQHNFSPGAQRGLVIFFALWDRADAVLPCRYELMWTAIVYVWPKTPILQFRACLCVLLLAIMRLLNLAVPVLYRNMVNKLSDAAIAASSGDPSGWQPTFWNVRPPLQLADLLHLFRTTHSSDHITETERQSAAGCCLPRP